MNKNIIFSILLLSAAPAAAQVDQINAFRVNIGMEALNSGEAATIAAVPEPGADDFEDMDRGLNSPAKIGDKIIALIIKHPRAMKTVEYPIIRLMAYAHSKGMLVPALEHVLRSPLMQRFLPPLPPNKREDYIKKFPRMIAAQMEGTGYVHGVKGFEDWEKMSARHLGVMKSSKFASKRGVSLLAERGFVGELESLSGITFEAGHTVTPLVDGPASFEARERLMRGAKKSVYLMVWGFYDDLTGKITRDLLIAKKQEGLDVRVLVDGNISNFIGMESLKLLAENGVPVGRFWDPARQYDGMHSKVLVVDGEYAVTGGMNIGDKYSHLNPDAHKWRDTDVLFSGPAVAEASRIFAETWKNLPAGQGLPAMPAAETAASGEGSVQAALVYQRADSEPAIYLSLLKAIYGAGSSINIENAYFVTVPSLKTALSEAIERGVKVSILTNSAQSNNEPILTSFILESLAEMKAAGAEIYVKEGETLHSKFMTVDGIFATVGSYNFHPKSIRHEREVTLHVLDNAFAAEMEAVFAEDIAKAKKIDNDEELGLKDSPLNYIARRYMFDQL